MSNSNHRNDRVQTLNYCAHCIEDLRELEQSCRGIAPESARVIRRLIDMLRHSVKFILPNCCNLIDPEELRQAHLDLVRLPYPCVAFEAPWEKEEGTEELRKFQQTPATKRIALCWEAIPEFELLPGLNDFLKFYPEEGGVFVLPIYWGPEHKKWTPIFGGMFLPYKNTVQKSAMEKFLPASRIANETAIKLGLAKPNGKQFWAEPFCLLPEFYAEMLAKYKGDKEQAKAQIIIDSRDETMMLVQACSVINCANVTTAEIRPSAALNKKRQEKGKQPFFSYRVLQLYENQQSTNRDGMRGNHASPRMHLRRGHLRRLESKVVWVRPAMVNAGSKDGTVFKDYAVNPKCGSL